MNIYDLGITQDNGMQVLCQAVYIFISSGLENMPKRKSLS
jgi:hypothetical protein